MNDLVTIDLKEFGIIKQKAGEPMLTANAEVELKKVLDLRKFAEELYDFVQNKLGEAMDAHKVKKIIAGEIVVHYGYHGERYEVNKERVDSRFTKEVIWVKPNATEIDKYVEEKGELPEGVNLKERNAKASISER